MGITLTEEQFKNRYGQEGLNSFKPTTTQVPQIETKKPGFFSRVKTAWKERFSDIGETMLEAEKGKITPVESGVRVVGDVAGGVGDVIGAVLSPQVEKLAEKEWAKPAFKALAGGMERYEEWKNSSELNRRTAEVLEGVVNIADLMGGAKAGSSLFKGARETAETSFRVGRELAEEGMEKSGQLFSKVKNTGVGQQATELAQRVPRATSRIKESLSASKARANLLAQSSEPVKKAMKSNLDTRIINTVMDADDVTKKAYKEMVDIASDSGNKLKIKKRPEIVAGDAVASQYDIIESQRKNIGKQIEATINSLPNTKININKSIAELDGVLKNQGIIKRGGKLDFTGSNYSKAQRSKISELYELATEKTGNLTPTEIYKKDQLFSQMLRESKFEGLGDIFITTADGRKSLYSVFRDVFNKNLDNISPEMIELNNQYRQVRTFLNDIENTLVKTGKFENIKGTDLGEVAQTRLRRLTSDAQSAAEYREIVSKLDDYARELGYEGARADDLIVFANEMRKLFPDTIPQTSLQGNLRTSLSGLVEKTLDVGKTNLTDQQKALIDLINSLE